MSLGLSRHPGRTSLQIQIWNSSLFRIYMVFRAMRQTEVTWTVVVDRERKRCTDRVLRVEDEKEPAVGTNNKKSKKTGGQTEGGVFQNQEKSFKGR